MRIEWVVQKGKGRVVVFYNGWGMDLHAITDLQTEYDLLVCSDYRSLIVGEKPDLTPYEEVYLVAWSMGVWAAANTFPEWNIRPVTAIAINGTERPVDDKYGIPVRGYQLTEKGMDEKGREKFFSRMLADKDEKELFEGNKPCRLLEEQIDELQRIHELSILHRNSLKWDKALISEGDLIFPAKNQQEFWQEITQIRMLAGGHYPFYQFRSWEEIIAQ